MRPIQKIYNDLKPVPYGGTQPAITAKSIERSVRLRSELASDRTIAAEKRIKRAAKKPVTLQIQIKLTNAAPVSKTSTPDIKDENGLSIGQRRRSSKKTRKALLHFEKMKLIEQTMTAKGHVCRWIDDDVFVFPLHVQTAEQQQRVLEKRSDKMRRKQAKKSRRNNRRSNPQYKHSIAHPKFSVFYLTYMKSAAWQYKRIEAFDVHGKQCVRCGGFKKLQCHHLTYERLGNENAKTDLEILCQSCHQKEHGRTF